VCQTRWDERLNAKQKSVTKLQRGTMVTNHGMLRAHCNFGADERREGGIAMLQAAEMHNGRSNFMLEIKRGGHLHRVFEVEGGYSCVAEEEGAAGELLSQANLEQV
jgi:hypothetical protein